MPRATQTEMKSQPKVKRKKTDVLVAIDRAAKKLDTARTERLAAQAEEKEAEDKCNALMEGHDLTEYTLSDGRVLRYGPKSNKMGCKIAQADEDEHAANDNGVLQDVE